MALRYINGFDYFTEASASRVFPFFLNGTSAAPGRFQGRAWQWVNQSGFFAVPIPNASTVFVGFAFYLGSDGDPSHASPNPTNPFIVFQDGTTSQTNPITQVDVRMTSDFGFQITRNGALIHTSLPNLYRMNLWNYCEIKVFISDTQGTIQIKINGQIYVNQSGLDTKYTGNNYVNMVRMQSFATTGYTLKIDDMYICDDTGDNNNGFRGECRVQTQFPTANGDLNQFQAIGAPTNWQAVDDAVPDDDVTYVRSGTTGDVDNYQMGTINLTGTIYGVQANVMHRKDDVGVRVITPTIKSNGHLFEGDLFTCMSDYTVASKIWEQEPQNVADWTNASVNDLKVGLKIKG